MRCGLSPDTAAPPLSLAHTRTFKHIALNPTTIGTVGVILNHALENNRGLPIFFALAGGVPMNDYAHIFACLAPFTCVYVCVCVFLCVCVCVYNALHSSTVQQTWESLGLKEQDLINHTAPHGTTRTNTHHHTAPTQHTAQHGTALHRVLHASTPEDTAYIVYVCSVDCIHSIIYVCNDDCIHSIMHVCSVDCIHSMRYRIHNICFSLGLLRV